MALKLSWRRWLPLTFLFILALAYEPIRSGFTPANQSCEVVSDWTYVKASIFNLKHIISYGILCLVAAATFHHHRILKAVVVIFLFSAFLEFEQSFFATGHCRARDLLPNLIGLGLAALIFSAGCKYKQWFGARASNH